MERFFFSVRSFFVTSLCSGCSGDGKGKYLPYASTRLLTALGAPVLGEVTLKDLHKCPATDGVLCECCCV